MEAVLNFLQQNIEIAPFVIVLLLTAAGSNIPLSEDIITITAALMAAVNPDHLLPLLGALLVGALCGDTAAYWIGRGAGSLLLKQGNASRRRVAFRLKIETMREYLTKRDIAVLILGRFIPFGFRNILHMTSGIIGIPYGRYLLIDIPAVLCTTGLLFGLVYHFGSNAADLMETARIILMIFLIVAITAYVLWRRAWSRRRKKRHEKYNDNGMLSE